MVSVCYYCILIFLQLEQEISPRHGKQEKIDDGESFSSFIWWRKNLLTQFIHFRSTCLAFISSLSPSRFIFYFSLWLKCKYFSTIEILDNGNAIFYVARWVRGPKRGMKGEKHNKIFTHASRSSESTLNFCVMLLQWGSGARFQWN